MYNFENLFKSGEKIEDNDAHERPGPIQAVTGKRAGPNCLGTGKTVCIRNVPDTY